MADVLYVLFILIVIGLALVGAGVVIMLLVTPAETERQRIARETREAERKITDIGREAQALILSEALKRAQVNRRDADGPWNG